jgi:hypothetical protein
MATLPALSSLASFIFLSKEETDYVEDDRKLLSRMSLGPVHNLVEKQKTF